jgi:hypothetical protein
VDGGQTISVRFVGSAGSGAPIGEQKLIRHDQLLHSVMKPIGSVAFRTTRAYGMPSVYPGIDAVFHGNREHLEYDFVLRPGADPAQIRIAFEGADRDRARCAGESRTEHAARNDEAPETEDLADGPARARGSGGTTTSCRALRRRASKSTDTIAAKRSSSIR